MKTVSFRDFQKHGACLFSDVEQLEIIHVFRHDKPMAEISPLHTEEADVPENISLRLICSVISADVAIRIQ